VAQPFDVQTLELTGTSRILADRVPSTLTQGSAVTIGDFAAAGRTLAYREAVNTIGPVLKVNSSMGTQAITVVRDWM
jgi:hypothetical protein